MNKTTVEHLVDKCYNDNKKHMVDYLWELYSDHEVPELDFKYITTQIMEELYLIYLERIADALVEAEYLVSSDEEEEHSDN
jgi:hypothetical protein